MDAIANTILKIRVDGVAEAKSQLKSLQSTEKELAEARVAGLEAGNKGLEKWIGTLGQVGVAIGVLKVGMDAFKEYAHHLDQESAAAGVSITKLATAAHGLKTNMELLEHAAIFNKSAFKLTQDQMGTVETAMRALEARGRDSAEVWQAMEAAITKGATKPLEQFGIIVDKTGLAVDENGLKLDTFGQKQQALGRIMEGLKKTAQEVEGEQMNAADQTSQQIVRLQNLWNDAKLKLGELVADIGSKLLPVLANSVERAAKLVSMLTPGGSGAKDFIFGGGILKYQTDAENAIDRFTNTGVITTSGGFKNAIAAYQAEQAARPLYATDAFAYGQSQASGEVDVGKFQGALTSLYQFSVKFDEYQKRKSGAGGGPSSVSQLVGATALDRTPGLGGFSTSLGSAADTTNRDKYGAEVGLQSIIDQTNTDRNAALTKDWMDRLAKQQAKKQNFLESTFGPIESFDVYAKAFQTLTGAVTAGLDAWIDGSVSAGEAIKKFIGTALKGLASQMAVESLKHGAYALGSLAFGDIAGASSHAAAAAAFGAGAAAAAVAAKEMGGGASVPAKGASSGGAGAGHGASSGGNSGGGGKSGGRDVVICYLDPFANQTESERGRNARKMVQKVLGGESGQDS